MAEYTETTDSRPVAPVLALDVGNVLIHLDTGGFARALGAKNVTHLLESAPGLLRLVEAFDRGRMQTSEFFDRLGTLLPWKPSRERIEEAWLTILGPEIPGIAGVVHRAVEAGLRPVLFSDICPVHHRAVMEALSFRDRIAGAVLSYEVGAVKPAAAMFEAMEREHCGGGVPALYVDDKAENVQAARRRGWRSYRFGTVEGFDAMLDAALAELEDDAGKVRA